jgi:hypothetical protein
MQSPYKPSPARLQNIRSNGRNIRLDSFLQKL